MEIIGKTIRGDKLVDVYSCKCGFRTTYKSSVEEHECQKYKDLNSLKSRIIIGKQRKPKNDKEVKNDRNIKD